MNQYTLDGVKLKDPQLRWFTDRETGIRIVPARRNPDHRFPGLDGVGFSKQTPYDPGAVSINLEVHGDTYKEFRLNLEFIQGLLTQRNKLMELREHYSSSSADDRVALVTLASSVEPEMITRQSAIVQALFNVPKVFWRSVSAFTSETGAVNADGGTHTLSELSGGNAPIDDMVIRIRGGSFSSMRIEDPSTGRELRISTQLLATETLLINPRVWQARIINGTESNTWSLDSGGRDVTSLVIPNRGYGSMFSLEPILDAANERFDYKVKASATNVAGFPRIEFLAKRSYL